MYYKHRMDRPWRNLSHFLHHVVSETTDSWAMHLKSQQSLLCFMLLPQPILGMTAFYLHEQSVTSVNKIKLVKKTFGFFLLFFFPCDSKQSAVSAISPVLSLALWGKQLLPLSTSSAFLSFISTSVPYMLERLYCLFRKVCFLKGS